MRKNTCSEEAAVAQAARSGEWPTSIAAHAAGCQICGEVATTTRWMQSLSRVTEGNSAMPEPDLIWWRAQLYDRAKNAERARAPLEFAAGLLLIVAAMCVTVWLVLNWGVTANAAVALPTTLGPQAWLGVFQSISFWSVGLVAFLLAVFVAFPALIEE